MVFILFLFKIWIFSFFSFIVKYGLLFAFLFAKNYRIQRSCGSAGAFHVHGGFLSSRNRISGKRRHLLGSFLTSLATPRLYWRRSDSHVRLTISTEIVCFPVLLFFKKYFLGFEKLSYFFFFYFRF